MGLLHSCICHVDIGLSRMNTYMNICESCGYGALTFIYMACGYRAVTYEYIYEYMRVMWIWGSYVMRVLVSYIHASHVDMGLLHSYMWHVDMGALTHEYIYMHICGNGALRDEGFGLLHICKVMWIRDCHIYIYS